MWGTQGNVVKPCVRSWVPDSAIHLATVANGHDSHDFLGLGDFVQNAIVARSNAIRAADARQLLRSDGMRVSRQIQDRNCGRSDPRPFSEDAAIGIRVHDQGSGEVHDQEVLLGLAAFLRTAVGRLRRRRESSPSAHGDAHGRRAIGDHDAIADNDTGTHGDFAGANGSSAGADGQPDATGGNRYRDPAFAHVDGDDDGDGVFHGDADSHSNTDSHGNAAAADSNNDPDRGDRLARRVGLLLRERLLLGT